MLAKVMSSTVVGIEAKEVIVEVDVSGGLPGFSIVGLPDPAVRESINRVKAAIKNWAATISVNPLAFSV